jgi:signal transduction histidine kinase
MIRSLAIKLFLAFLAVNVIGVAAIGIFAMQSTEREFGKYVRYEGRSGILSQLEDFYNETQSWDGLTAAADEFVHRGMGPSIATLIENGDLTILDQDGLIVFPEDGHFHEDVLTASGGYPPQSIFFAGETIGTLNINPSALRETNAGKAFLERINQSLLVGTLGAAAVSLLLALLLSRQLTNPVRELTEATLAISAGNLEYQVPIRTKDELGDLARSFNQMSTRLTQARDLRQKMTADIAHELRTPLSVILGHAEAVSDGVLPPSADSFAIIHEQADRLDRIIEDLRVLSRADAGELHLNLLPTSSTKLIETSVHAFTQQANQKQISIEVALQPDLPEIHVDSHRFSQVMGNLLSNAIRYTPNNGKIDVSARRFGEELEISISDDGPGIAVEDLAVIFERFYRGDPSRQRDAGGSGLGLAIARSIVEGHAGRIWAESPAAGGARFILTLPASPATNS